MKAIITKHLIVEAEYYKTRYSWEHKAYVYLDGEEIAYQKAVYYNRTWESYQFESVLKNLLYKCETKKLLSKRYLRLFKKMIENGGKVEAERVKSQMNSTAMVASLGALFGANQKESNDWKARMLKAGLPGLDMPEDWDELSEDEKQTRLDKVIKEMNK